MSLSYIKRYDCNSAKCCARKQGGKCDCSDCNCTACQIRLGKYFSLNPGEDVFVNGVLYESTKAEKKVQYSGPCPSSGISLGWSQPCPAPSAGFVPMSPFGVPNGMRIPMGYPGLPVYGNSGYAQMFVHYG
jgi:hypothetical protein